MMKAGVGISGAVPLSVASLPRGPLARSSITALPSVATLHFCNHTECADVSVEIEVQSKIHSLSSLPTSPSSGSRQD